MNKEREILILSKKDKNKELQSGRLIFYILVENQYINILTNNKTPSIPIPDMDGLELMLSGCYLFDFMPKEHLIEYLMNEEAETFKNIDWNKNDWWYCKLNAIHNNLTFKRHFLIKYIRENPDCIENI